MCSEHMNNPDGRYLLIFSGIRARLEALIQLTNLHNDDVDLYNANPLVPSCAPDNTIVTLCYCLCVLWSKNLTPGLHHENATTAERKVKILIGQAKGLNFAMKIVDRWSFPSQNRS